MMGTATAYMGFKAINWALMRSFFAETKKRVALIT